MIVRIAQNPSGPLAGPPSPKTETIADTDGMLDWDKVTRLAWRPAWSIRSRRGSVAPFMDLVSGWYALVRGRRG